ncbi:MULTISPECIES: DUF2750 domain-containing protein [Alteromonadaceae]|uniref:DUF2750 domain-containing protein n=1 Tax=Alteromonadaceae TaxID=72275 RepID=UPI001C0951B4|nr:MULTISPECIES: DUF2750 domain-containing protein [Aliiglaciecola]MBU2879422.1 DUF2750 domain-containing protein [Aliiglaciecola lipolytica]MDO6712464.1 DUF2750 domain-containing protein [Aliiglaciecola sp. 2_MG-2023]MDO6753478.1 DUF2750 domain-containing protein [Aliiglaciecola sp. 1_MG-2023]
MPSQLNDVIQMSPEKRHAYLLTQVTINQKIWILTDEHGCVMLNSEDEDCVPVWPSEEFAEYWATGDWAQCTPKAIPLQDWFERWTGGLEEDGVNIAVFPNPDEEGIVVFPDVFDSELKQRSQSKLN